MNSNRISPPARKYRRAAPQLGVTLIELLVALTVSLVLVLAAAALFISTSGSQRSLDELSTANESGAFATGAPQVPVAGLNAAPSQPKIPVS
jgi:type IV pilus assembly protein PilW